MTTTQSQQPQQQRSAAGRLTRVVVNVVLVAVTLVAAAYLVPSVLGFERYVITGGSMSGTFEKGSIAFEKPVPVADLRVGDVITYQPPADSGVGGLVTHRIVSVRDTATDGRGGRVFRTQGDANADPDPWRFTLAGGTQNTVAFTVPTVGWAVIALSDRDTRMLVIGVPAALVTLLSLVELAGALVVWRRRGRPQVGPAEKVIAAGPARPVLTVPPAPVVPPARTPFDGVPSPVVPHARRA